MEGKKIESFEDLDVYKKLCELHLEISHAFLKFPQFELYELGSQLRRSSNASPANIAEGWNNRHINIYLEGINRAMGELQETLHHLKMAYRKGYFSDKEHEHFRNRFLETAKMLRGLERSLEASKLAKGKT
jgi:four helix bundle protein